MKARSVSDSLFTSVLYFIMFMLGIITLYPFLNALAISLNDSYDTMKGGVTVFPRVITLENYKMIIGKSSLGGSYFITVSRTIIGTASSLLLSGMLAYALSKPFLKAVKFYNVLILIPMFFNGGMIPSYLLIRSLGLIDSFLVYIVPGLIGLWNVVVMRTYFKSLPESLEEAALIDGAGYFVIFFNLVIPLSAPIFAVIALFTAVGHWNSWFDAYIYINKYSLKPVMTILMEVINSTRAIQALLSASGPGGSSFNASDVLGKTNVNTRSITMATMIVTVAPILCIYPFLQKYFVKGIMVGSFKG